MESLTFPDLSIELKMRIFAIKPHINNNTYFYKQFVSTTQLLITVPNSSASIRIRGRIFTEH